MNPGVSSTQLRPLKFEPLFVPRIWGARSLAPLYDHDVGGAPIGEVWLTGNECVCATPPFQGRRLADVWREMSADWAGTGANKDGPFPLLVKFLFPEDKLSVQVHPDDEFARTNEAAAGGTGKTETWYVVAAQTGTEVFAGLREGVTREIFLKKIADGSVEECLREIPVSAREAIFVPAGTAHTIGAGSVLCEIQEHSDLTYRVFDYNRRNPDGTTRELHIEKAMAVMNFGEQRGGKVRPVIYRARGAEIAHYVACRYFAMERWNFSQVLELRTERERFEVWVAISGRGKIMWGAASSSGMRDANSMDYGAGEVIFIPAALGGWRIEPESATTMIHAYVPDLEVYQRQLVAAGVPAEEAARIIHR